jgi:hypothetical protein
MTAGIETNERHMLDPNEVNLRKRQNPLQIGVLVAIHGIHTRGDAPQT